MPLELFVFIAGLVVTLIMVAGLAFTVYEVRRTNPHAFGPKSQVKLPSDPQLVSSPY